MTRFDVCSSRRPWPCPGRLVIGLVCAATILSSDGAFAQNVESVGSRALGMGGAFVAVANDSSAGWWNPAGLAAGPFIDASFGRFQTEQATGIPAGRTTAMGFAFGTPPAGFSYYRLRITEIPTASAQPGREDEQGGVPLRSLFVAQTSATLVYSLMTGVHVGTTLKYMRGTLIYGAGAAALDEPDLLEIGDDLDLDDSDDEHRFEFDLGVLAVKGPARAGFVIRNVRQAEFNDENPTTPPLRLPRQYRLGGAFDGDELGIPLTVSLDVDLDRYQSATGDRRVVAFGAEYWVAPKKLALRGGARFNTVGSEERAVTTGASYALRTGFFVDGHAVFGGDVDEQGWGLAARVSF